eukprot:TRINITY_DN25044_c0_g1_i1.p1 TRINITY_DN25044_c0_g1~~TRINITY_DN25044_c0_g1_i1.p1  ORF type:complete len:758 (+),score=211.94 TRINITY_DN25044_c0_g1_i1:49-2322(+)
MAGLLGKLWLALPAIAGLVLLIVWLAMGRGEIGWKVTIPLLALVPLWTDAGQAVVAAKAAGARPSAAWKNFPGTAFVVTALFIVLFACVTEPSDVWAQPLITGKLFSGCSNEGRVQLSQTSTDIARFVIDGTLQDDEVVEVWWANSGCQKCALRRIFLADATTAQPLTFHLPTQHTATLVMKVKDRETVKTLAHSDGLVLDDQAWYSLDLPRAAGNVSSIGIHERANEWDFYKPIWGAALCLIALQVLYAFVTSVLADYLRQADAAADSADAEEGAPRDTTAMPSVLDAVKNTVESLCPRRVFNTKIRLMWTEAEDLAKDEEAAPLVADQQVAPKPVGRVRLVSLDVMRGMSLAVMNFVNVGGGGYWFFDHSKWSGLTIADIVFPWFIWVMGVAMALSLESTRIKQNRAAAALHIMKRAALLFLIGMFLGASADTFEDLRITGVLNRFGISYLVVGFALLYIPKKAAAEGTSDIKGRLLPSLRELPVFGLFIAAWLVVTFAVSVHVDGFDCSGYVGPGGVGDNGRYSPCTGAVAAAIDRAIFGSGEKNEPMHRYGGCTATQMYTEYDLGDGTCKPLHLNDPEGFLGTLNSIVLCWLGVVVGRLLRPDPATKLAPKKRAVIVSMVAYAAVLGLIGGAMAGFSQFDGPVPVNKNLWTTSFVLVLSATGALFLLVLLMVVDWARLWEGKPFLFVGMNSMLFYFFSEFFQVVGRPPFALLRPQGGVPFDTHGFLMLAHIIQVAVPVIGAYWFWRNELFFKL